MSSDQLTALDATFLDLEQADASAHMHIGAVLVFDPPPGGRPPTLEAIGARATERLAGLPRYRQRLSSPHAGGLRLPHWEADPGFRLDAHLRRAALPAPGGAAELVEWAGDFFSHRLDRSRALWEVVLVEGLEGGRWALATKTHHCLVDGVGSLDAGLTLFDGADAEPATPMPQPEGGSSLLAAPIRAVAGTALHPRRLAAQSAALADLFVRDELVGAPHTSLNVPIGTHRRLATVGIELDQARRIKAALGGTVNDVVLTAVTAGLRALLLARGEAPPAAGLRAMVPVDLRGDADRLHLGNRVSSIFVRLPVAVADSLDRYESVKHEAAARKRGGEAGASSTLLELARYAPLALHAVAARSALATRLFNLTVTNVPGPQFAIHAFGSRLRDAIPIVPLAAEHAIGVAVLSLDGRMVFCLNCDHDAVPDAAVAAGAIAAELDRLEAIADGVEHVHDTRVPGAPR